MKVLRTVIISVIALAILGGVFFQLRKNKRDMNYDMTIASRKVGAVPVKAEKAHMSTIDFTITTNGVLEANHQLTVVSETQGKITHLYKHLGDYVQKGEVIAKVEDETIRAAEMVAEANVQQHERDIKRYERLSAGDAITKHDLEEAKIGLEKAKADFIKAKKALDNTSITAPISGVINQKFVTEGQFLAGGMQVCEIVDNHQLKIHVKVDGDNIYNVQKGEEVQVVVPVFPDRTFHGVVTAIAVKADKTMNFDVEITLDNTQKIPLKSGLYAEVNFPVKSKECLVIPKESIVGSMVKPQVFVIENNKAVLKDIVTGLSNNHNVQVISGIKEGDQVIYSGQLNLSGNEEVKVIQ
ncbi:MAG: efflux RND transporter periplasmic adaptor subunit [Bacteroidales bacterium]|nr:efflux RND transporter periplasmic adaptor subunit [Bacteroidales bacterium]